MKVARAKLQNGTVASGIINGEVFQQVKGLNPIEIMNVSREEIEIEREYPLSELQLTTPAMPSKIVCIGRNYVEHAAEFGNEVPSEPLLFFKPPSALIGHNEQIIMPRLSKRVDYEGELGIVLRKKVRKWSVDQVNNEPNLLAVTNFNDVTARDIQRADRLWTRGKGFDTFAPVGPWMVPVTGIPEFKIETRVNGVVKQSGDSSLLVHKIPKLISYISQVMTLYPGDIIATGTPAGVGELHPNDIVEVDVDIVGGALQNGVLAENKD